MPNPQRSRPGVAEGTPRQTGPTAAVIGAVATLAVDAVATEVMRALRLAQIQSILLKGRSFADWLYDPGEARPYFDCDLLVSPDTYEAAGSVLSDLGFRCGAPGLPWVRGAVEVDLHDSLVGVRADKAHAWRELRSHLEVADYSGGAVDIFDTTARAFHVAIHAAQHGRGRDPRLEDLARAIERVDSETWRAAAHLADELEASAAFAVGLCLDPAGRALLGALEIDVRPPDVEVRLRAEGGPEVALTFEKLHNASGVRAKLGVAKRALVPAPGEIRYIHGLEDAGPARLVAAYVGRLARRLQLVVPGFRAWLRARRGPA